MTTTHKLWIKTALNCLEESLSPVPHETNEIDWKVRLSDKKDRLVEHLIAFSNQASGGFFVFGINNGDGSIEAISQESAATITNTLANLGRDAIEPKLAIDHAIIDHKGVPILVVHVPEQRQKPAHRPGKGIEETYVRSGGTTRIASRQEVGSLMMNSSSPTWEELRASDILSLDEVTERLDLAFICKLLQKPQPNGVDDLVNWLKDQKIAFADGRGYYISNFGAIAAAKELDQFETIGRKRIRLIRYAGANKVNTIDELEGHRGYAVGFEKLIQHLKRILPHSEVIEQSLRTEASLYPEIALRELIANTLVHQDFSMTGAGPMVEIFDDRIEFTNPGTLLPGKRTDRLIGTAPESRNEVLASKFRQYRICEERGTGFEKVVTAAELFGLPPIAFTPGENSFRVTLYAPRKFAEMSQQERIEACYQHAVLHHLSSKTLTNTTLRERFKLHEKQRNQVTNLIGDAVSVGRIKRKDEGSGNKFAEYVPYWA
jgi:ATP-dependent DNA helicase RecG